MRLPHAILSLIAVLTLTESIAQTSVPTLIQAISDIEVTASNEPIVINLKEVFAVPGVDEQVVQFDTSLGVFNIELFASAVPITVNNFLNYVNEGTYTNTIIHFTEPIFLGLIQGGRYTLLPIPFDPIPTGPSIMGEPGILHNRGTISTTVISEDPNTATAGWHINVLDNGNLYPNNTVFGEVIGTGIDVINSIATLSVTFINSFTLPRLPVINYFGGDLSTDNIVFVFTITPLPVFPEESGGISVLNFEAENSNPALVTASFNGSQLTLYLAPEQSGTADITVRAIDSNDNISEDTFRLSASAGGTTPVELVVQGSGNVVGENIQHPSGNIFDQVLMTGESIKLRAKNNQITRVSLLDENEDILQVEFSGSGILTVELDPDTFVPAAPPAKYNQPSVSYVRGWPTVRVEGADANTFLSIFTVGSINAVNQALFPEGVVYDAEADVKLVEVLNSSAIGGMQFSNVVFSGSSGKVGIDARGVTVATRVTVGDIEASGVATPHLLFAPGSFTVNAPNSGMRITGGDLFQSNGLQAVLVAEEDSTDAGFTKLITQNNFKSDETPQPTQSITVDFANEDGIIIPIPIEELTIE